MIKVALLGDSIRLWGYGTKVPEMLGEEYEVFQPEDNCRFVKYTLRMIFDLHEQIKDADVIHFNCGHWDVTDLFGDEQRYDVDINGAVVSNGMLHDEIVEIMKQFVENKKNK